MAAIKSPTTRILALAVLIVTAGVLSLRLFDLFGEPAPTVQTGSAIERELSQFLSPVFGTDALRVSVRRLPEGGSDYFILVDQTAPELADDGRLQSSLASVAGYDPARDQLQIVRAAFPRANGLSFLAALELAGLGLVLVTGLGLFFVTSGRDTGDIRSERLAPVPVRQPEKQSFSEPLPLTHPPTVTLDRPEEAARIIRAWMAADQELTS